MLGARAPPVGAPPPVYATVEVDAVNVPATDSGVPEPESVIVRLEASKVPAVTVNTPATVRSAPAVKVVPARLMVKLLYMRPPVTVVAAAPV